MGKCLSKQSLRTAAVRRCSYSNTVEFVPPITQGQVIKVYDGDTITIASCLPGMPETLYRFHVRLSGIDAPEIKSSNETEKKAAHVAQDSLSNLILGKIVTLRNTANEKYGRLLADVYLGDLHVNAWMLQQHFVVPYDGKTKAFINWETYHNV